ncbi:MAG: TolC family protein [Pirellulales bacterium]|nr:TolC family protein [Pirellulales bacterium]
MALASLLASGCAQHQPRTNFQNADISFYKEMATQVEVPDVDTLTLDEVTFSVHPFTLKEFEQLKPEDFREISLEEAVQTALANSKVVRQLNYGSGPSEGGAAVAGASENLLRAPDGVATVYDPALQETSTGGGFGGIGVEAALAAFDAQLTSSVTWNRNERPVNTGGIGQSIFATNFNQDLGAYRTQLSKQSAVGTTFFARHNANYELNNNPTRGVPSDWQTNVEVGFNQPLLQGWGTHFNRVAGPNSAAGVYRGVAIARINNDITLADFEASVRDQVKNVEDAYWELYMAYRALDASMRARDGVLKQWNIVNVKLQVGGAGNRSSGTPLAEAQARAEYFRNKAALENSLRQVYRAEQRLRFLMGLASTDGRLFRPLDEPTTAPVGVDWVYDQCEMLARTVELRRQRWRVKQREMELTASKNFLLPRLDASGTYRLLGAGDTLIDPNGRGVFPYPGSNAFSTLTDGDYQEWQLGLNFSMNLGFRQELAGVRNAQLQLARARAQLQEQELEASHLLAEAIRNLESNYVLTQTRFNAWLAARREAEIAPIVFENLTEALGGGDWANVLRAITAESIAETNYYRSLINYNRSIAEFEYRKGSLLEYNNIYLAEGPWPAKAYADARDKALLRSNAVPMDYTITKPGVFSRGLYPQHTGDAPLPPLAEFFSDVEPIPTPAPANVDTSESMTPTPTDGLPPGDSAPSSSETGGSTAATAPDTSAAGEVRQVSSTADPEQGNPSTGFGEKEDLLFRRPARESNVETSSGSLKVSTFRPNEPGQRQKTADQTQPNSPLA